MNKNTISSQVAYNGRFLKVIRDTIKSDDGQTLVREYVQHPGASLVVPLLESGNLITIRQYRYPLRREFIEFPAGKIDPGETPEQTALRELEEEIGFRAGRLEKLTEIHPCIGYADEVIHIYLAQDLEKTAQKMDSDEKIELLEINPAELKNLLFTQQMTDAKSMIAAFWFFNQVLK